MVALVATGFSSGSEGPRRVAISFLAAAAAASKAAAAFSSPSSAGVTALDSAASMFVLPEASTASSLSGDAVVLTRPAMRPTPATRAASDASHGSPSTRAATPATPENSVLEDGINVPAEMVTLSMDSRALDLCAALPVAFAPPPPTHPLALSSFLRLCCVLKFSSCCITTLTRLFASSYWPASRSAAASVPADSIASVAASSEASAGQVTTTVASATAETAPSASITWTPSAISRPCASKPPGRMPSQYAFGEKSCMLSGSAVSSPTTRDVNLYCRGASSSVQAMASTRNVVLSATPSLGTAITDPSPGGVFSASVAKAAAAPLASVASSRKVYVYPVSSASGDSTRFLVVSEEEEMNASPEPLTDPSRSTASTLPSSSSLTRVADQSSARVSGAASESTVACRRATSPALTFCPGRGGMDTLGGAPVAPAAALTTVTLLSVVALLAPLVATSAMAYVCPAPAAPTSCSDSIRAEAGRSMT